MVMKQKFVVLLFLMLLFRGLLAQEVLPVADFPTNFCNFPFAWQHTLGENVEVIILRDRADDQSSLEQQIQQLAPRAAIISRPLTSFLKKELNLRKNHVVFIASEIQPADYDHFLEALGDHSEVTFAMPAYFGPMVENNDYAPWRDFVSRASQQTVIIIGTHGDMYQLGDLTFWKHLPIDFFAPLREGIKNFAAMDPEFLIPSNLEGSAYLGVAAIALARSHYPDYSPARIRQMLREKGRKVHWSVVGLPAAANNMVLAYPHFDKNDLGGYERDEVRKIERNVMQGTSLDMAVLFGHQLPAMGGWCMQALEAPKAREIATGKKKIVAILDHSFNRNHPLLKDRYVSPVSMIEGEPALSEGSSHGTDMAIDVLLMAPDALIMPIVVVGNGQWGEAEPMIRGIRYAVENGADVISCSQGAIKGEQDALDEAIEQATRKGVTFVFINYKGNRHEVIVPAPVEFAKYHNGQERVYMIGTNFIGNDSPITWGVSHTAPILSGLITMMREVNPDLQPARIRQILLQSTKETPDGWPILNAHQALLNANP